MWDNFGQQLYDNIIKEGRLGLYWDGLKNTLYLTLGAAVIGIILGSLVAHCQGLPEKQKKARQPAAPLLGQAAGGGVRPVPDCHPGHPYDGPGVDLLLDHLRQCPITFNFYAAMIAFGINSGAYVAEIVRAGINAVNIGQTEAGRSLGLTGGMTMRYIVLPQAIKNILPALANEAITLLKETAIVGYAAQQDITYVATLIRSRTYSPVPLLFIALVYLILVLLMTYGTRKLERRLARSDRS